MIRLLGGYDPYVVERAMTERKLAGRPDTATVIEITRRLAAEGRSDKFISDVVHRHPRTVMTLRRKYGIAAGQPANKGRPRDPDSVAAHVRAELAAVRDELIVARQQLAQWEAAIGVPLDRIVRGAVERRAAGRPYALVDAFRERKSIQ